MNIQRQVRSISPIFVSAHFGRTVPVVFQNWRIEYGQSLLVKIYYQGVVRYQDKVVFGRSFAQVAPKSGIIHQFIIERWFRDQSDSFSAVYKIGTGNDWTIELTRLRKELRKDALLRIN